MSLLMPAAVVHSSTARFAHKGTGTVRMCFALPIGSEITQHSARSWKSCVLSPTSSARLKRSQSMAQESPDRVFLEGGLPVAH